MKEFTEVSRPQNRRFVAVATIDQSIDRSGWFQQAFFFSAKRGFLNERTFSLPSSVTSALTRFVQYGLNQGGT